MPQLASLSRLGVVTTFAVLLAAACGGQSFTGGDGGDGGDAGSTSTAGKTSKGGSTGRAGSTSTAGRAQGGSATTGGATTMGGTGVTAGAGGATPWNEACEAAPISGNCDAYFPAWYHEPATGICRPFVYGGCGGNANRYGSLAECQQACPGGNPNYDACKAPSDCILTGTGCCGVCDSPDLTEHDLVSYNQAYANQLQCGLALNVAGGDAAGIGAPIACAPCAAVPGAGTLKNFLPTCVANECAIEDVRTSAATACKTGADCKLRNGTGCCEGCAASNLIAVRNDGSFEKMVCGDGPVGCPACLPAPNPGAIAACGPSGHCQVEYLPVAAQ